MYNINVLNTGAKTMYISIPITVKISQRKFDIAWPTEKFELLHNCASKTFVYIGTAKKESDIPKQRRLPTKLYPYIAI